MNELTNQKPSPDKILNLLNIWKSLRNKGSANYVVYKKLVEIHRYLLFKFYPSVYGLCWCQNEIFFYTKSLLVTSTILYLQGSSRTIVCNQCRYITNFDILTIKSAQARYGF